MISEEMLATFESLCRGTWHHQPVLFWSPWVSVTESEAFDMRSLLMARVVGNAMASPLATPEKTAVPIEKNSHFQKVVNLTAIAPWSELLSITKDGKAISLNPMLSEEERNKIFRILSENSCMIVNYGGSEEQERDLKRRTAERELLRSDMIAFKIYSDLDLERRRLRNTPAKRMLRESQIHPKRISDNTWLVFDKVVSVIYDSDSKLFAKRELDGSTGAFQHLCDLVTVLNEEMDVSDDEEKV